MRKIAFFNRSRDLILTEEKPQNLTLRPCEYRKSQYVVRKSLVKFFMYICDKTDELYTLLKFKLIFTTFSWSQL